MKKKPLTLIIFDKINKDFSEHSVLNCISLPASCMMHIKVNTVAVQLQFIGVIIEIHFFLRGVSGLIIKTTVPKDLQAKPGVFWGVSESVS